MNCSNKKTLKLLSFLSGLILFCSTTSYAAPKKIDYVFHRGQKVRPGEFIIKLKNPTVAAAKVSSKITSDFISKAQSKHGLKEVASYSGIDLHHMKVEVASGKTLDEQINEIKSQNIEVDYVEPNYIVEKAAIEDSVKAQAYSLSQVLSFVGTGYGLTGAPIGAQSSWGILISQPQASIVAVIDSGVDLSHPSLSNSLWKNTREIAGNGIDDDGNGFIDDVNGWNFVSGNNNPQDDEGHGTHVAGIVLGVAQNIFTTTQASTKIKIMPLKFLDSSGMGTTSDAIKAIYYAANNGAFVTNNSWGGGLYSHALLEAIAYSYNKDVMFVAAAGNSSKNNDAAPNYPANYDVPNVISVAATDDYDSLAGFSNYGKSTVNLSSPGVSILSTWPGGYYAFLSGTSMATPFVAGAVALMKYQSPLMNTYQIKQLLLNGVDPISGLSSYIQTSGRLNVYSAVNLASTTAVDPYKPSYVVGPNRELASSLANRGGGCGMVSRMAEEEDLVRKITVTLALLLLPLFFTRALKTNSNSDAANRRRHPRFEINSEMKLKLGEQELVGAVRTISLGGTEINTQALLKEGSVISMVITSPDGREKVEVQGHIVWSQSQKRYGVAFKDLSDQVKSQISLWTQSLSKAA